MNAGFPVTRLYMDDYVCPFKYFCKCSPCAKYTYSICEKYCGSFGKDPVNDSFDENGCKYCSCQCKDMSCTYTCAGHGFERQIDKSGCPVCDCLCLEVDCDAECGVKGLGMMGMPDNIGCRTCDGCRENPNKGNVVSAHIFPEVFSPAFFLKLRDGAVMFAYLKMLSLQVKVKTAKVRLLPLYYYPQSSAFSFWENS